MPNRVLGSWLGGPRSSGLLPPREEPAYPGARLGLPEQGPGALAGYGRRFGAYAVDAAFSAVVATAVVQGHQAGLSLLVFALEVCLLTAVTGRSLGMWPARIRVRRLHDDGPVGVPRALLRTLLILLLIPVFVTDLDGRGLHDRLAGTVLVRG